MGKVSELMPVEKERGKDYDGLVSYAYKKAYGKSECELTNEKGEYFRVIHREKNIYDVFFNVKHYYGRANATEISVDRVVKVLKNSKFLYTKPVK